MTVKEYFTRYAAVTSQSDSKSESFPSTPGQLTLAELVNGDLCALGISSRIDEYGYVYGEIPASPGREDLPVIGLIAHMDTSEAASGRNVKPQTTLYRGGELILNAEKGISLSERETPELTQWVGTEIITSDGTTLLGADDKAGIAEIMAMAETLVTCPELPHGIVKLAFTPDEEIGKGTAHFDLKRFGADFGYTVDGGALGELEYENFNAAAGTLRVRGISTHPGTAKGKMVNAASIASEFIPMLPKEERPETTEGYEGFYHLCEMAGTCEEATLSYIIRDHDMQRFAQRKSFFCDRGAALQKTHPEAEITVTVQDSYYNMRSVMEKHMDVVERAAAAMGACGVKPIVQPIRGGTDGAMLTFEGLPCPNLSTGGYLFHSRYEFIPVPAMEKMTEVLLAIVQA